MAEPLVLNETVSEPLLPLALVLDEVVPTFTAAETGLIYWRWNDDTTAEPELLGEVAVGKSLRIPFDPEGRDIRLFLVSKTDEGDLGVADIKHAEQIVFTAPAKVYSGETDLEASETIAAFALVNIWNDAGDPKARNADATDNTRPCHAFVREGVVPGGGSFGPGDGVRVFFGGNIITTTGRTSGATQYLSETAGAMTETAPTGSGKVVQEIGTAISATEVIFEPQPATVLP